MTTTGVLDKRIQDAAAIIVVLLWSISCIDGIITKDYTALGIVTPVMMLVGTFIFGLRREIRRFEEGRHKMRERGNRRYRYGDIDDDDEGNGNY